MSSDLRYSVVLPVHNQADHITDLVERYVAVLEQHTQAYELLLLTNGCTDDSVERCAELAATHGQVLLIELETGGWGHAVRRGIAESTGELVCYTNSARTSPETLALMLLYATIYPNVVVKANRRVRDNITRRLGSLLYNLESRALFDLSVWDINGTPKIFPRKFEKLLTLERDDDLIDLEFNVVCRREGYAVIEVPILSTQRHGGSSTTSLKSATALYLGALRIARERRQ